MDRVVFREAQFLGGLPVEGFGNEFPVADVTSDRRIPAAGLYVLVHRAVLQIDSAHTVDYVQMHNRVQDLGPAVAVGSGRHSHHLARSLDHREQLLVGRLLFSSETGICRWGWNLRSISLCRIKQFKHFPESFRLLKENLAYK